MDDVQEDTGGTERPFVVVSHPLPRRWVVDLSFIILALLVTFGSLTQYLALRHYASSTNEIVRQEVPSLKVQLADERQKRQDDEYILTQEAVPAIQRLAAQVKALGGDPGQVVLKPPDHPTTTTTTVKPKN